MSYLPGGVPQVWRGMDCQGRQTKRGGGGGARSPRRAWEKKEEEEEEERGLRPLRLKHAKACGVLPGCNIYMAS